MGLSEQTAIKLSEQCQDLQVVLTSATFRPECQEYLSKLFGYLNHRVSIATGL